LGEARGESKRSYGSEMFRVDNQRRGGKVGQGGKKLRGRGKSQLKAWGKPSFVEGKVSASIEGGGGEGAGGRGSFQMKMPPTPPSKADPTVPTLLRGEIHSRGLEKLYCSTKYLKE